MASAAKTALKKLLGFVGVDYRAYSEIPERLNTVLDRLPSLHKATQLCLMMQYRELFARRATLPFADVELRVFSQNGEDGILLYIFSVAGMINRRAVEICAGDGIQCNTANLIINHGFEALLFDGDSNNVARGRAFYGTHPDTRLWPPRFVHAWITTANINELIAENGFSGELDLLSLDLDGMDYWVWQSLSSVSPRVVVLECNNLWGPDRAVTIPYRADFRTEYNRYGADYLGASLAAFVKLGRQKGYRLVGCQRYGFNAFFLRNDVASEAFPEVAAAECLDHPFARYAREVRVKNVVNKEWVEV